MVVLVIMVMVSILARLVQLAPVSLSMRIDVVVILRQLLRTRRLTGRLHNNRRHRSRGRPQYRACVTVHRTAFVLVVAFCLWLLDHDWFHRARIRSSCKRFAQMTLDLLAWRLHRQSRNWTRCRRLAANLGAFELASNRTPTPERARVARRAVS